MRLTLLILMLLFSVAGHAQFYYYNAPQQQRQKIQQEKYTSPKYKKGKAGVESFIMKNFHNPSENTKAEGKIVVAAIIDKKGKVADAQIVRSVSKELDTEALRVVRKMKFKPAKLGKKKTKARLDITFPIKHGRLSFIELNTIDV